MKMCLRGSYLVNTWSQSPCKPGAAKTERVRILREQVSLDMDLLADILKRHELEGKWK